MKHIVNAKKTIVMPFADVTTAMAVLIYLTATAAQHRVPVELRVRRRQEPIKIIIRSLYR